MPTPLDYERFRLSQGRFDRQGSQFDDMMGYRQDQMDYRAERDIANDEWRAARAAQQDRMALLRMLPQAQRGQAIYGRPMSGPAQAEADYEAALARQDAHNYAAVPSWHAERDRSNAAAQNPMGIDLRAYAAQQQMRQMGQLQQREGAIMGPMNDMLARQAEADATAAREKSDFENMGRIGKIYGADVGDLYSTYKDGYSTIPGKPTWNQNEGKWMEPPGRKIAVTPGHFAAMQSYMRGKEPIGPVTPKSGTPALDPSMRPRLQQAANLGARPEVVGRAMETLAQMGGGTEEELQDLIAKLSDIDVRQQASLRRTAAVRQGAAAVVDGMGQQHRDAARQAAAEWEQKPWWEKLPKIRGGTPLAFP